MFAQPIQLSIDGGLDLNFPKMTLVRQQIAAPRLEDPAPLLQERIQALGLPALKNKQIAIGVGSRGIARQTDILVELITLLKAKGAQPFIVPAMGSHGGATAAGQAAVLEGYGITEETMGVPIRSAMEAVLVDRLDDGTPLYCDALAFKADGIVVLNKVKPHADYKGDIESGLAKMIAIGLSKHKGATNLHFHGFERFSRIVPEAAAKILAKIPFLFGIAVMENAYDQLMDLHLLTAHQLLPKERELLAIAKENIPRILVPEIDVLIIDEIGKNISGEGMDPNVTGRPGSHLPGFEAPRIQKIVVLDVTPPSHGNGVGIGMADVTTTRVVRNLDLGAIYTNAITAGILDPAKLPMALSDDRQAISVAVRTCPRATMSKARIVHIKNTLEVSKIRISDAVLKGAASLPELSPLGPSEELQFNSAGRLRYDWQRQPQ